MTLFYMSRGRHSRPSRKPQPRKPRIFPLRLQNPPHLKPDSPITDNAVNMEKSHPPIQQHRTRPDTTKPASNSSPKPKKQRGKQPEKSLNLFLGESRNEKTEKNQNAYFINHSTPKKPRVNQPKNQTYITAASKQA